VLLLNECLLLLLFISLPALSGSFWIHPRMFKNSRHPLPSIRGDCRRVYHWNPTNKTSPILCAFTCIKLMHLIEWTYPYTSVCKFQRGIVRTYENRCLLGCDAIPHIHPEDGGSMVRRIVGISPYQCIVSVPRRPRFESSSL